MKAIHQMFVFTVAIILSQVGAFSECGGDENLTNELEKAALKASEWLRYYLVSVPTQSDSHIYATAYHSLRLAGYQPVGNLSQNINASQYKTGRLALYVNGFTATCQNPPEEFIRRLKNCTAMRATGCGWPHLFPYLTGALALCNNGETFDLSGFLANIKSMNYKKKYSSVDTLALASITLSCVTKRLCQPQDFHQNKIFCSQNHKCKRGACKPEFQNRVRECKRVCECKRAHKRNKGSINLLLGRQDSNDGSFGGNGISTALAAQALLAYNDSSQKWQCPKLMRYLLSKQNVDGSLGGLMSTIQILPVLKGVTLMGHERIEQGCNKTKEASVTEINQSHISNRVNDHEIHNGTTEDEKYINVTLRIETKNTQCSYDVTVNNQSTVYEIFIEAEKQYSVLAESKCDEFKFRATSTRYGHYIESILVFGENEGLHSEHYWIMYTDNVTKATVGIDSYRPKHGTTVIFKLEKVDSKVIG